jgi:hypothetical protein
MGDFVSDSPPNSAEGIMNGMVKSLIVVLVCVTSVACESQAQALREVSLPSGKKVKVMAAGRINFSNDSPALMLKYQTDLKISDTAELRKEVEEIWAMFKADVEQAKLTNAIISANEVPHGLVIKTGNAFNFVYKKSTDGRWELVGGAEKPPGKAEAK